jgi:hypothetical protein
MVVLVVVVDVVVVDVVDVVDVVVDVVDVVAVVDVVVVVGCPRPCPLPPGAAEAVEIHPVSAASAMTTATNRTGRLFIPGTLRSPPSRATGRGSSAA